MASTCTSSSSSSSSPCVSPQVSRSRAASTSSWFAEGVVVNGRFFDVAVVGGGLAGLSAAYRLLVAHHEKKQLAHGKENFSVAVFDSDSVIGGRVRSKDLVELFGEDFIHPLCPHASYGGTMVMLDNRSLIGLAQEMRFLPFQPKLYPNFTEGAINLHNLVEHPFLLIKLWLIGRRINREIRDATEKDWKGDHEDIALDAIPLETWLQREGSKLVDIEGRQEAARQAVRDWFFQLENFPTDNTVLSTFYAADAVYKRLSHIQPTGLVIPRILRWESGTGVLIEKLVAKIRALGGHVYSKHRVIALDQPEDKLQVNLTIATNPTVDPVTGNLDYSNATTVSIQSRHVVVASAPDVAAAMNYTPPLPEEHLQLGRMIRVWDDPSVQIIFVFKTDFWNKRGVGMSALPPPLAPDDQSNGRRVYGPVFDLSERPNRKNTNGIIRILVQSRRIKDDDGNMWPEERIRESALQYLNTYLVGDSTAPIDPELAKGRMWVFNFESTPDIKAVTFYFEPTIECSYAKSIRYFRRRFNRIHFAGAERADRGFNWMEGAVRSGNLASASILKAIYGQAFEERQYWKYIKLRKEEALNNLRISENLLEEGFTIVDIVARFFKHTMWSVSKDLTSPASKWLNYFSSIDRDRKQPGILRQPRFALEHVNDGLRSLTGQAKELSIYTKFRKAIAEDMAEEELPTEDKKCTIQ